MPSHITITEVSCDPSTINQSGGDRPIVTIGYTNDGDEPAEYRATISVSDPSGNQVHSAVTSDIANPGGPATIAFGLPPDLLTQPGTYTVTTGVEGGDQSHAGSCQFTVQ